MTQAVPEKHIINFFGPNGKFIQNKLSKYERLQYSNIQKF